MHNKVEPLIKLPVCGRACKIGPPTCPDLPGPARTCPDRPVCVCGGAATFFLPSFTEFFLQIQFKGTLPSSSRFYRVFVDLYWVLLGFAGNLYLVFFTEFLSEKSYSMVLYWVRVDSVSFLWTCTGFCWEPLPSFFYRVLPSFFFKSSSKVLYRVRVGSIEFSWTCTGFYWVLLGIFT